MTLTKTSTITIIDKFLVRFALQINDIKCIYRKKFLYLKSRTLSLLMVVCIVTIKERLNAKDNVKQNLS